MTERSNLPRVLVADDQADVLQAVRLLLSDSGLETDCVSSVGGALERARQRRYDLALVDLNYTRDTTSGREGLDLVSQLRQIDPSLPVVVMTGWGSIDIAVEAMRRGARSFVQKPWEDRVLVEIVEREIADAHIRREHEDLVQREAAEAQAIQRSLLPVDFPEVARLQISAGWRPAMGVGGDCFDVLVFSRHRLAIAIADVAGKGMPAAILMSNMQAAIRAFAEDATSPRVLAASANRLLCRNVLHGRFVTFCYLTIDTSSSRLLYCNAGHNPPIVLHADGTLDRLATGGVVLGVFPDAVYGEQEVELRPGDRLVAYTDGITEALDAAGEEYGEERLIRAATSTAGRNASAIQAALFDDVLAFAGGALQDDATVVVAVVEGNG